VPAADRPRGVNATGCASSPRYRGLLIMKVGFGSIDVPTLLKDVMESRCACFDSGLDGIRRSGRSVTDARGFGVSKRDPCTRCMFAGT